MNLPAQLTMDGAAAALQTLRAQPGDAGAPLHIDASALTVFDTSALAVLLQARRDALAGGRGFEVQGAPPQLAQLAQLYGVDQLLGLNYDAA